MNIFNKLFHKMSDREKNIAMVTKWFRHKKKAEFALSDKHFGRPGDWSYSLEKVYYSSGSFVIELDTNKQFVFEGDFIINKQEGNLEISGYKHLIFVWEDSSPGRYHTEEYDGGKVTFLPDPYVNWK